MIANLCYTIISSTAFLPILISGEPFVKMPKLKSATFTFTEQQLEWLREQHKNTGIPQTVILRLALDAYVEAEANKQKQDIFTPEQLDEIKQIAREKGVSESVVIRAFIDKELRHRQRLRQA